MTTTNAMRLLKQAGIEFETASYEVDESDLSGVHAAAAMGLDPARVFKTLVARGEKHGVCVFCIPVACELDLKKCAAAAGEKNPEKGGDDQKNQQQMDDEQKEGRRLHQGAG